MAVSLKKVLSPTTVKNACSVIKNTSSSTTGPVIKTLVKDTFQSSGSTNIVDVYQAAFRTVSNNDKIISRHFGGCHGVGIFQNGKMFFAHFPPFQSGKLTKAIKGSLPNFKKEETQVVFISPISRNGTKAKEFERYLNTIKEYFGQHANIKYLDYVKGDGTYQYTGVVKNGTLVNTLKKEI